MTNTLRHLLLASAALGLASALVYLYNKTEAVDLGKRNEIVAMLRTLQDVDNRWDVDILRARMEIDENSLAAPDRAAAAQRALRSLAAAAPSVNSPALSGSLGDVTKAINEKASLVDQYKAANGNAKSALRTILAVPVQPASESAPRKADARPKEFQELLGQIAATAVQYYWNEQDVQRKALEIQAGRLQTLAAGLNTAALREQAAQMDGALKALLAAKPVEQDLYAKVSLLTSGPRLDGLSLSFNRELEVTLEDKERYRVYMIAYAASLLIGIGYLGARLKGANESLERRVAERTRELSEALQHLKESEAQLIQSEKMSSLGQMVAGVAHEINTPLAYVSNSITSVNGRLPQLGAIVDGSEKLLALLRDQNLDPDELNRQFSLLSEQIEQLRQHGVLQELAGLVQDGIYGTDQVKEIVGNLRDFSRLDRSKVSSFNLNDGLNSTLGLARHLLKAVTVTKNFGDIPPVTCAPSQINQVFLNLITNAVQALPQQSGEIRLTTRSANNGVAVEVADNGSGIPPEVLPKIFDPFFTTKEIGKGTGLGLSISYKIVQDHGGRIDVDTQVGKGTKFTVWLPLQGAAASGQAA